MFGIRRKKEIELPQKRDSYRWAVEILQIYHIPLMPSLRQGWYLVDVYANQSLADEKARELSGSAQVRVREIQGQEEEHYEQPHD